MFPQAAVDSAGSQSPACSLDITISYLSDHSNPNNPGKESHPAVQVKAQITLDRWGDEAQTVPRRPANADWADFYADTEAVKDAVERVILTEISTTCFDMHGTQKEMGGGDPERADYLATTCEEFGRALEQKLKSGEVAWPNKPALTVSLTEADGDGHGDWGLWVKIRGETRGSDGSVVPTRDTDPTKDGFVHTIKLGERGPGQCAMDGTAARPTRYATVFK